MLRSKCHSEVVSTYGVRGPVLVSRPALATPTNFKIDRGSHATALLARCARRFWSRTGRIVSPQRTQRLIFHLSSSQLITPIIFGPPRQLFVGRRQCKLMADIRLHDCAPWLARLQGSSPPARLPLVLPDIAALLWSSWRRPQSTSGN
jgi:hypothetical protein